MPTVHFPYERSSLKPAARILLSEIDGDTPFIQQPVRMASCDTPEKASRTPAQPLLNACRERLQNGFYDALPLPLREYLISRLTEDAAARHNSAGLDATLEFQRLLERRLTHPDGTKRRVAVIPTGELIDLYGRMLAYIAPWFDNTAADPLPPRNSPDRLTLNYHMILSGWAVFLPIYPSLPANDDLNMAIAAAEIAWNEQRGMWGKYGADLLLGYEYRQCIIMGKALTAEAGIAEAYQRTCVDLRTLQIVGEYRYFEVPPPYRLWIWFKDIEKAKIDLALPAES